MAASVFVLPMLIWGYAPTHDFVFHVGNWIDIARQWHQGIILPRWAPHANYGFGEPRFIFYPPLGGMLGAALSTVMPWKVVPGAFVFVVLIIAGTGMYVFAREWLPERYAVLSALVFMLNPYQVMLVYKRMAAAEMLASAIFPVFLLFAFRAADGRRQAILPLALAYAAIWLTNAPSAVMASYAIAVVLIAMAIRRRSIRPLLIPGLGIALGMALSAFYIIPAAWEQRWVDISLALTLPNNRPENNFIRLFPPRLPGGIGSIIGVGVLNLALAAVVCWMAFRRRRTLPWIWWACMLVAAFATLFTLPFSLPLWKALPKMIFVQLPWRWLYILNAVCALLLGAVLPLLQRKARVIAVALPVFVFLVLVGAYSRKGTSGRVAELQSSMETQGGVWPEAQYLPIGETRGPSQSFVLASNASGIPVNVRVRMRNAEHIVLETDRPHPETLLLNISWFPAWTARVNGVVSTVLNQNGQVGVDVPAGPSMVDLRFNRTFDRTLGGIISLLTIAGIGIGLLAGRSTKSPLRAAPKTLQQRA
jgi:uncharacterized membrane protein